MPEEKFKNGCIIFAASAGALWGTYNQESIGNILLYAVGASGVVAITFLLIAGLEKIYENIPPADED